MRSRVVSGALFVFLAAGCTAPLTVFVDVLTARPAGIDFDQLETSLYEGTSATPLDIVTVSVEPDSSFALGARVAEFSDLVAGSYSVEVRLLLDGAEVDRRRVTFAATTSYAVTVPFEVGFCMVGEEICNGVDDDCDGALDEGEATELCMLSGVADASCESGACQIGSCVGSFLDCDSDPATGCEVDSATDSESCGACGAACDVDLSCDRRVCRGLGGYVDDTDLYGSVRQIVPVPDGGFLLEHDRAGARTVLTAIDAAHGERWTQTIVASGSGARLSLSAIQAAASGEAHALVHAESPGAATTVDLGGGSPFSVEPFMARDFLVSYSADGAVAGRTELPYSPYALGMFTPTRTELAGVDDAGNRYVYGCSSEDIDLGGGRLTGPLDFVASYDSAGVLRWAQPIPNSDAAGCGFAGGSFFSGGEVDAAGRLLLRTRPLFSGGVDLGSGDVVVTMNISVAVLYDPDGNVSWLERHRADIIGAHLGAGGESIIVIREFNSFGGPMGRLVEARDAAGTLMRSFEVGPQIPFTGQTRLGLHGDLYFGGLLRGANDFGGGRRSPLLDVAFLASYGPDGDFRFDFYWSDTAASSLSAYAVNGDQILLAGSFTGELDFGGGARRGEDRTFLTSLRD